MDDNEVIEADILEMVTTRYNVVTGLTEVSTNKGKSYSSLTDRMEKTILRRLRAKGHKVGVPTVRNIVQSDFSNLYNPFQEYFNGLENWDGETNHIEQLCSLVEVENDEYFKAWFTKWIVAIVASCLDDKVVNHQVFVIAGGQGIGKTTFFTKLVPSPLTNYFATGYVNPENKDAQIQASECFLINMDELSSLNAKSIEAFKQLVTQTNIRVRRPYGYNAENLSRRASFCGSTNEEQFLEDLTGNRRFLCFKAIDINLDALCSIDFDKVYAQAVALYKDGFQFWFNKEENKLIEQNNEDFVVRTVEDEAILSRYEPCGKDEVSARVMRVTSTEIMFALSSLGLLPNSGRSTQKIGKALVKLGFIRYKSNGRMLYCVRLK